jgi:hypothetical protein
MKLLRKGLPYFILLVFFLVLFGRMLPKLNQMYFASGGDGLKAYYCAWYHAQYDESSSHFKGMNYPWGESVYFTDGQAPVASAVRWVHQNLSPVAHYIPGIFNFLMLFSLVLSALFLFLIFKRFKLPDWFSFLVALGMVFLSPQIGRLTGHFSLAWGFWIPLLIYLTLLIIEKQRWLLSFLFALVTLLASLMHMYFFLFAVALMGICWFDRTFIHRQNRNGFVDFVHLALQIIVPFVLLQLIMVDNIPDRTMHPWGFYEYRAFPATVFLPLHKWYAPFLDKLSFVRNYDWESYAYIGAVAAIGLWFVLAVWCRQHFSKKEFAFKLPGREFGILLWASGLLLLFSFGIPFIFGLEKLRNSIGFLSQLRAVARFSWLFFYVANIAVWVLVYRWAASYKSKPLGYSLLAVFLLVFGLEAFDYAKGSFKALDNPIEQLADKNNLMEENRWVNRINVEDYQAIMPLPYFHIGSESSWVDAQCGIDKQMYIASLKTGLPCVGVMMGRTSLSQTYKNIALSRTPWTKFDVLDEYPNRKPLLLMVAKCDAISKDEQRLVEHASLVASSTNVDFYKLTIDSLEAIPSKYYFPAKYVAMFEKAQQMAADSSAYVQQNGGLTDFQSLVGINASAEYQNIVEAPIKLDLSQPLYLRFWIRNYAEDMVARTNLVVYQSAPDHQTLEEKYTDVFRHIKSFNGPWALIEIVLQPKQEHEIVKLLFKNETLAGKPLYFDEFSVSQIGFN